MALFQTGQVVITRGALAALSPEAVENALRRHTSGDWGEVDKSDSNENDLSLREGFRILSAFRDPKGTAFWIITEADRSSTTVLLPEEY